MSNRVPKSVRSAIRDEYLRGEGTCRELAEKHGLPHTTIENWCRREGWRAQLTAIDGSLTAATEPSLVKRANDLVARRAAFLERTLAEGEALLDRIEQERAQLSDGDLDALRKLVQCWRPVTELHRKSLGLDEPQDQKADLMFHLHLEMEEPPLIKTIEAADCGTLTPTSSC
jgi:hypothetical protein